MLEKCSLLSIVGAWETLAISRLDGGIGVCSPQSTYNTYHLMAYHRERPAQQRKQLYNRLTSPYGTNIGQLGYFCKMDLKLHAKF